MSKLPHREKPIPTTINSRSERPITARPDTHKIGHTMGIQQRSYQRRRRMERSLQNQLRPLRTMRHVLWTNELPKHIPNNDGYHLPGTHSNRRGHRLYGRYSDRNPRRPITPPTPGCYVTVGTSARLEQNYH